MVTVFTPVFNRKNLIGRLYESLRKQSDKGFEWIIVDDGSNDGLCDVALDWVNSEKDFLIKYIYVKNGGKHRAINIGVKLARFGAFFIADSDDYLSLDAIEFINHHFHDIEDDAQFAGISGLKSFPSGEVVGGKPNFVSYVDAKNNEREKYSLLGDKAEIYKTSVLRKYPFPEFDNENFIPEGVVWNKIAHNGLKIRWFNKSIYYCEYLEDGLSKNFKKNRLNNPVGMAETIKVKRYCNVIDNNEYLIECYTYLLDFMDRFNLDEIFELLGLDSNQKDLIHDRYNKDIKSVMGLIKNQKDGIAIYGMGSFGTRLKKLLEKNSVKIEYGIDENSDSIEKMNIPIFTLSMTLPDVEYVIIAVKKCDEELIGIVKDKINCKKVIPISQLVDW